MDKYTTLYELTKKDKHCNLCYKDFSRPYSFKRHLKNIHGFTYEDYYIDIIDKNTINKDNITLKTVNIHKNTTQNTVITYNNVNKTNNTVSNKNICTKCNKTFARRWNLTEHSKRCKGFIDKFSCQYCNKAFTHEKSRFKHFKTCKTKKECEERKEKEEEEKKEDEENTIIKTITFEMNKNKVSTNIKKGIVYLVQPEELIGTNRYKVGCSSKASIERLKTYKKGSHCILVAKCKEPFIVEKEIIKEFNKSFNVIAGNEYYEGDESEMVYIFLKIYSKYSC